MMRKVVLLSAAEHDLRAARDFYALEDARVGDYCLDSLLADIDRLSFYAVVHRQVFGYYRLLASRFPFSIYSQIIDDVVVVAAVMDNRRNPKQLRRLHN